jgi:hypothetical protein
LFLQLVVGGAGKRNKLRKTGRVSCQLGFDELIANKIGGTIMAKPAIVGWVISLVGTALWIYGYYIPGNTSVVDWHAHAPSWISMYLPNIESEIGAALAFIGMIPIYWKR